MRLQSVLRLATLTGLLAGLLLLASGLRVAADLILGLTTVSGLIPLTIRVIRDALRREAGVDIVALLAMAAALAFGEYLAGAVIAVMLATGGALEDYAGNAAKRELTLLLQRAPKEVHRYEETELKDRNINDVHQGDLLFVKPGEVVPVDGVVASGTAVLDESTLTGESRPVERAQSEPVQSGTVNAGAPFDMIATTVAAESTYAGIVRLVSEAQAAKSPFVRLADRYALVLLPLTLSVAGLAWLLSGDPVRALAVLVVATPCPLILAAPIALIAGVSRAAKRGIIMKGGSALEGLSRAKVLLFDKTGTLTQGRPVVNQVVTTGRLSELDLLKLAGSLDQASPHVLATAIVKAALDRKAELVFPSEVFEKAGWGIRGKVADHLVLLGRPDWITEEPPPDWVRRLRRRSALDGSAIVFVGIDGALSGAFVLEDQIRADSSRTIRNLKLSGIERIVMVTGDHPEVADTVANAVGVDQVLAQRSPQEKVEAVIQAKLYGLTIMVGDGINDAPALATADVGVAMGARGATASSEAADVVLVVDRLERLNEAIQISRRARGIALQSVVAGMGMSAIAMGFAAIGMLPPVTGALLQECIDLAVILNALRALGGYGMKANGLEVEVSERFRIQHVQLWPMLDTLRSLADRLDTMEPTAALGSLTDVLTFLSDTLMPHERAEETELYPLMAKMVGGDDPTAPMVRTHAEIAHLIRVLRQQIEDCSPQGPAPDDLVDLRRQSLADIENELKVAKRANAEVELADRAFRRRLEELGISAGSGQALDILSHQLHEVRALIDRTLEHIEGGEGLSLALSAARERARQGELEREYAEVNTELARLQSEIEARERTGRLASLILDALREATIEIVGARVAGLVPLFQRIYSRIDPHPAFRAVDLLTRISRGRGRLSPTLRDHVADVSSVEPSTLLSSSQTNALAVSIFLALNLAVKELPLQAVILDDPLQSLDDVNLLGTIDLLRRTAGLRQLVVSTHDTRFGSLLERKLRPVDRERRTTIIRLDGWSREGPSIEQSDVPRDTNPLKLVG